MQQQHSEHLHTTEQSQLVYLNLPRQALNTPHVWLWTSSYSIVQQLDYWNKRFFKWSFTLLSSAQYNTYFLANSNRKPVVCEAALPYNLMYTHADWGSWMIAALCYESSTVCLRQMKNDSTQHFDCTELQHLTFFPASTKDQLTQTIPECGCASFTVWLSSLPIIAAGLFRRLACKRKLALLGHHWHESDTAVELPSHICPWLQREIMSQT